MLEYVVIAHSHVLVDDCTYEAEQHTSRASLEVMSPLQNQGRNRGCFAVLLRRVKVLDTAAAATAYTFLVDGLLSQFYLYFCAIEECKCSRDQFERLMVDATSFQHLV